MPRDARAPRLLPTASLHKLLALPVDCQYAGHGCGAFGLGKEWLAAGVTRASVL